MRFVSCALFYINLFKSLLQVFTEKQGSPLLVYSLHIDFIHLKVNTTKHPSHLRNVFSHMTELKGIGMSLCKVQLFESFCSPVSLEIVVVTSFFISWLLAAVLVLSGILFLKCVFSVAV